MEGGGAVLSIRGRALQKVFRAGGSGSDGIQKYFFFCPIKKKVKKKKKRKKSWMTVRGSATAATAAAVKERGW